VLTSPAPTSSPPTSGTSSASVFSPLSSQLLRRLWPAAALAVGGGVLLDGLGQVLHVPLLAASTATAGLLLLGSWSRSSRGSIRLADTNTAGWLQRLDRLQQQFAGLDPDPAAAEGRRHDLEHQRAQLARRGLHVALVGTYPGDPAWREHLAASLGGAAQLSLHWSKPLPPASDHWSWPEPFSSCDVLVFALRPPLLAADLRWLQAIPAGQPLVLLVQLPGPDAAPEAAAQLRAQLPDALRAQVLCWHDQDSMAALLRPLAARWAVEASTLRSQRQQRCLAALHTRWQGDLEGLRRSRFQQLQQRTQWLVAAGVVVAPLPSLDLLVLAVANGLMVKDMARLWDCPWGAEQLQATAVELARAALSLGVVEWSTQALAGVVKWHGPTWLLGGAVQALSAAYLTRVVGRAMADTLARSVGVAEPDLERIRREAPLLVAQAAETEKLDWPAFLRQGRQWLAEQARASQSGALNTV
jgi:uncharacterized protein